MPITDVHNHVIPTDVLDLFRADPSFGVTITDDQWIGVHHVPFTVVPEFYDVGAKLHRLDETGIDVAILSAPPPLFFYDVATGDAERLCAATNEGLAKFAADLPDRFAWLANLPIQDPDRAVETYRAAVADGARGAALGTSVAGRRLDEPAFEPFWAAANEIGLPILLHPAFNEPHAGLQPWYLQNVIGNPLETAIAIERLLCAGVLHRNPELRLILLHGGGMFPYQMGRLRHARGVRPDLRDAPDDLLAPLPRLYFDTITHDTTALRFLERQAGAGNVVLGTDMPFDMAPNDPMTELHEAFAPDSVRRIAEANPEKLFPVRPRA